MSGAWWCANDGPLGSTLDPSGQHGVLIAFGVVSLVVPSLGRSATRTIGYGLGEMLLVIPPTFILLGLLDVWVPREKMVRYMGPRSGFRGGVLPLVLGSAAAGPLYAAFPVAAVLMRKGAGLVNVLVFIGAWSTTKIPMLLFEHGALGSSFAVTRLLVDIPGIVIIAYTLRRLLKAGGIEALYARHAEGGGAAPADEPRRGG